MNFRQCRADPLEYVKGKTNFNIRDFSFVLFRLIADLESTQSGFEEEWVGYERRLVMCIKVRQFEVEFKEVSAFVLFWFS